MKLKTNITKRRNRIIFLVLFITLLLILIFNSYTLIISDWIGISIGVFSLIIAVLVIGVDAYGLWLVLGDEF